MIAGLLKIHEMLATTGRRARHGGTEEQAAHDPPLSGLAEDRPPVLRILADIGMIVLVYYVVTTALYMIILLLPLFGFRRRPAARARTATTTSGTATSGWAASPRTMAPATSSISA